MKISADAFEAFLKCSTKCWLRAAGEQSPANAYAECVKSQNQSYCADAAKRVIADVPANECEIAPVAENLKTAKWRPAVGVELCMPFETRMSKHKVRPKPFGPVIEKEPPGPYNSFPAIGPSSELQPRAGSPYGP